MFGGTDGGYSKHGNGGYELGDRSNQSYSFIVGNSCCAFLLCMTAFAGWESSEMHAL